MVGRAAEPQAGDASVSNNLFKIFFQPRTRDLYDVFCGVLYVLKSGCQWRIVTSRSGEASTRISKSGSEKEEGQQSELLRSGRAQRQKPIRQSKRNMTQRDRTGAERGRTRAGRRAEQTTRLVIQ